MELYFFDSLQYMKRSVSGVEEFKIVFRPAAIDANKETGF